MKYVLIGNSAAATACIEGIRTQDTKGEITVISSESRSAYGRPLISYALLGKIKKENMDYRPPEFYEANNVILKLGETVTKIDAKAKQVVLESGEKVAYDKLLVATGSRPFVPPLAGLDKVEKKFTFMTYADMEAIGAAISPDKNVLVLGAGLIGLKCTEGLLARVGKVTVVDMSDRILPSVLDSEGAAIVQKHLEECGVKFVLGDSAEAFEANQVKLKSGKKIEFDILVVAVGVRPNVELVKDAGGKVNRGIVVGDNMKTSLSDIYAAGDCTEGYDKSIGANRILALLPNAAFQGKCAGINMAGGNSSFTDGIPMNALGLFDCHIVTAGIYEGGCVTYTSANEYKKLFVKDGKLAGFILINAIEGAGIYTSLIREGVSLGGVDWELLTQKPQLLAFSEQVRREKLAHKV